MPLVTKPFRARDYLDTPERMLAYIDEQDAEIERLRAALRPFVRELDGYTNPYTPDSAALQEPGLTVGDLRRAALALGVNEQNAIKENGDVG